MAILLPRNSGDSVNTTDSRFSLHVQIHSTGTLAVQDFMQQIHILTKTEGSAKTHVLFCATFVECTSLVCQAAQIEKKENCQH